MEYWRTGFHTYMIRRFTFFEMMIVVVIMAMLAAVVLPPLSKIPASIKVDGVLNGIRRAVTETATRARSTSTAMRLVLDAENSMFLVEELQESVTEYQEWVPPLERSEEVSETVARALQSKTSYEIGKDVEWLPEDTGLDQYDSISFAFYEDGQAAGLPLRFRVAGHYYELAVDKLTGMPLIDELE